MRLSEQTRSETLTLFLVLPYKVRQNSKAYFLSDVINPKMSISYINESVKNPG